jgi:hypothetical protein
LPALGIAHDVCGVEQVDMPQAADGAGLLVRPEHPGAEDRLVQAELGQPLGVRAGVGGWPAAGQEAQVLVDRDLDVSAHGVVGDDVDGEGRDEDARSDAWLIGGRRARRAARGRCTSS